MESINKNGILIYIRSIFNSLTKSEQKVAEGILNDNEKIVYSTITDFAELCEVGDATVLRFCRKVGYKSYQSFKLDLAKEIANLNREVMDLKDNEITIEDTLSEIARKTVNSNIFAINETLSLLNLKEVAKAVELLVHSRKVSFFGAGSSQITVQDAAYKFLRIGFDIGTYSDYHIQLMQASLLTTSDVAIGISFSGSTKDTFEVLQTAKNAGAKIISITHHAKSPITKISDIVLLHGSKEGPLEGGLLPSKVSQLIVIDVLYNAVFKDIKEEALRKKEITSKAISERLQ
ncbi:MAG TPA: MurR/RpiR family transcriptional regulator [Ruminiclostridium sp.]